MRTHAMWRYVSLVAIATQLAGCLASPGAPAETPAESSSVDATPNHTSLMAEPSAETMGPARLPDSMALGRTWYAVVGDNWIFGNETGRVWQLPIREKPQDVRDGVLLTVALNLEAASSTVHTYDASRGDELMRVDVQTPVNAAAFWRGGVIYAPSSIGGGVWAVPQGSREPDLVLDTTTKDQPSDYRELTRTVMTSSASSQTAASEVIVNDGNEVTIFRDLDQWKVLKLPEGFTTASVTDAVLLARSDEDFIGIDLETGRTLWQVPYGGWLAGAYVASDGEAFVFSRFNLDGTGALELVEVPAATGELRVVHSWPSTGDQPALWPSVSTATQAVLSTKYEGLGTWYEQGAGETELMVVDLKTGNVREMPISALAQEGEK